MNEDILQHFLDKVEKDKVYEIKEVATILEIGTGVVYNLVAEGALAGFRFRGRWKISGAALRSYVRESFMAGAR